MFQHTLVHLLYMCHHNRCIILANHCPSLSCMHSQHNLYNLNSHPQCLSLEEFRNIHNRLISYLYSPGITNAVYVGGFFYLNMSIFIQIPPQASYPQQQSYPQHEPQQFGVPQYAYGANGVVMLVQQPVCVSQAGRNSNDCQMEQLCKVCLKKQFVNS